jgi:hypothetical protein
MYEWIYTHRYPPSFEHHERLICPRARKRGRQSFMLKFRPKLANRHALFSDEVHKPLGKILIKVMGVFPRFRKQRVGRLA